MLKADSGFNWEWPNVYNVRSQLNIKITFEQDQNGLEICGCHFHKDFKFEILLKTCAGLSKFWKHCWSINIFLTRYWFGYLWFQFGFKIVSNGNLVVRYLWKIIHDQSSWLIQLFDLVVKGLEFLTRINCTLLYLDETS